MNVERLKSYRHPVVEQDYTWKDTILYALGLGCGVGAANDEDLRFVYEGGLQILPSMSLVLGMPKFWLQDPEVDVDWVKVLHGEQRFTIHRPLQPNGRVRTETRALGVDDKGTRGAVLYSNAICSIGMMAPSWQRCTQPCSCAATAAVAALAKPCSLPDPCRLMHLTPC